MLLSVYNFTILITFLVFIENSQIAYCSKISMWQSNYLHQGVCCLFVFLLARSLETLSTDFKEMLRKCWHKMWGNDLLRGGLHSQGVVLCCCWFFLTVLAALWKYFCFQICHHPNWHHKTVLATAGWNPVEVAVKNIRRLFCRNETSAEKEATHKLACACSIVCTPLYAVRTDRMCFWFGIGRPCRL